MLTRAIDIPELKGDCPAIASVREGFESLSRSRRPVLLSGEPGTGKEEVARAFHRHNGGTLRAFVVADTSESGPAELELSLFGPDGGLARASKGTVYFEEIGALTPAIQATLLRFLQSGKYYSPGSDKPLRSGARIMAATSQDLDARVQSGLFNRKLLAALRGHEVYLPPLRERREDIPALINHYLMLEANALSIISKTISKEAASFLAGLEWPGNLPQLDSVCRRMTAFTTRREIGIGDLPGDLAQKPRSGGGSWSRGLERWAREALSAGQTGLLSVAIPEAERVLIRAALEKTGGQRQEAARLLGWGRNTLSRKIRDLNIDAVPTGTGEQKG